MIDMATAKTSKTKVNFTYSNPRAKTVQLAGDFTGWQQAPLALKKQKDGVWKASVQLPPGVYEYRLLVDGVWTDDPQCKRRQPNQFGGQNCVCVVEVVPSTREAAIAA